MPILKNEIHKISTMVTESDIENIINKLAEAVEVEGDVVELGCNVGTTSLFIQQALLPFDKKFHVYDSFEGIPEPQEIDETDLKGGMAKTTREVFESNFESRNIPIPEIHVGWFKDQEYPEKICFAFFDGDMYSSIMDSFEKVYSRMPKGGIVIVHDYGWSRTKGVVKACNEFLKDKPEVIEKLDLLGIMVKQ